MSDNPILDLDVQYSINRFPGDGSTDTFDLNFAGGYILKEHVKAYVSNDTTDANSDPLTLTWIGPNQVQVAEAPATGTTLVVYRDTPKDAPVVNFTDGAIINEKNLDTLAEQAVFASAEVLDQFKSVVDIATQAATDAAGSIAGSEAAQADAADAVATANAAEVEAAAAVVTADAAAASAADTASQFADLVADVEEIAGGDFTDFSHNSANLGDLTDAEQARANIGLDQIDNTSDVNKPVSTATQAAIDEIAGDFLLAVNNLSDLEDAGDARDALGLGGAAVLDVGTGSGTVAAGNDGRFSTVPDDYVTQAKMHDASVGTAELIDANVTTGKLAADAVTNAKLADDAVETANIKDANVTAGKLATGSVTGVKLSTTLTLSGVLNALPGSTAISSIGDITATRSNTNVGFYFLGTGGTKYMGFDGTNMVFVVGTGQATFDRGITARGDITALRNAATTTGYFYFGDTNSRYIGFDGTNAQFQMGASNYYFGNTVQAPDFYVSSDARLKSDIQDAPSFGAAIDALRVATYIKNDKPGLGVIAQEVQEVMPELVYDDGENYLSVNTGAITYMLLKEIQELRRRLRRAGL